MKKSNVIVIVMCLVLGGCYASGEGDGLPDLCDSACAVSVECGGMDLEQCVADCTALPLEEIRPECTLALDALYVCLLEVGCDGVALYESGLPFGEVDYPCRDEDERALSLECSSR